MDTEKSKKLLEQLKTARWLPPYNPELITEIEEDISKLFRQIELEISSTGGDATTAISHSFIARHKRIVLAYLSHRLGKLERLRWESGPSIPAHFKSDLHSDESEYFKLYNNLLNDYSSKVSRYLDVTTDTEPPKDVYVTVKVDEEYGEIVLPETGPVALTKHSLHLLKRTESVALVKQGVLQHIN